MSPRSSAFSRRDLLSASLKFGIAAAWLRYSPLPALAGSVAQDSRIAATPLVDKGFASVRKVGTAAYATISDSSKGPQTLCNGGFIAGRDAALIVEGHMQPAGAAFEVDSLRMVSKAPVRGALNTHYHFDHTYGNAYYGANGIPVWAHAKAAGMMQQNYAAIQGRPKAEVLGPVQKQLAAAKEEKIRKRIETDVNAFGFLYDATQSTVLALPNDPIDPAKGRNVDLGGVKAEISAHPGHTPTDLIVRIPNENITFTGDLLFNGMYPVTLDADMAAWRRVMRMFGGYGKDALFIPGHGQICGQDGISGQIAVMDHIGEHAEKMFKAGVPVGEAINRYEVPQQFAKLGIFSWAFTIGRGIESYYAGFKKGAAPPKKG